MNNHEKRFWQNQGDSRFNAALRIFKSSNTAKLKRKNAHLFLKEINGSLSSYKKITDPKNSEVNEKINNATRLKEQHLSMLNESNSIFIHSLQRLLLFLSLLLIVLIILFSLLWETSSEENTENDFWLKLFEFGSEENVEVPFEKEPSAPLTPFQMDEHTSLNMTVIKSAIVRFAQKEGRFPQNLEELTRPFPNNYLSKIPASFQGISTTSEQHDLSGGWYYERPRSAGIKEATEDVIIQIADNAIFPNTKYECIDNCRFEPLEIHINKDSLILSLMAGEKNVISLKTALGKNNSTPEGEFSINKRVSFPNHHLPQVERVYGTRGLELSDERFAIHGTNSPENIGSYVSAGCIRLVNADIETLFAITPLYTPVIINSSTRVPDSTNKNQDSTSTPLPADRKKTFPPDENAETINNVPSSSLKPNENTDNSHAPPLKDKKKSPTNNKHSTPNNPAVGFGKESDPNKKYQWAN